MHLNLSEMKTNLINYFFSGKIDSEAASVLFSNIEFLEKENYFEYQGWTIKKIFYIPNFSEFGEIKMVIQNPSKSQKEKILIGYCYDSNCQEAKTISRKFLLKQFYSDKILSFSFFRNDF